MDKKSSDKKGDEIVNTVVERYCTVRESLIESCKEMKLIREGKMKGQTWAEYRKASKEEREKNTKAK